MEFVNVSTPPFLNEAVGKDLSEVELHDCLKGIARKLVPQWSEKRLDGIVVAPLCGGLTNLLYVLQDGSDKLIIRLYGYGTELFIDRNVENTIFSCLSDSGISPKLHGLFVNGRIEGFLEGRPLDVPEMRNSEFNNSFIVPKIAHALSYFHAQKINIDHSPSIWPQYDSFVNIVKGIEFDTDRRKLVDGLQLDALVVSMHSLRHKLCAASCVTLLETDRSSCFLEFGRMFAKDVVFSHNDLLAGNILLDEASVAELDARRAGNLHTPANVKGATFIDYEYGGYNARAFDVANHFCEFNGVDIDYDKYFPDENCRRNFVRHYLEQCYDHHNKHNTSSDHADVLAYYIAYGNATDEEKELVIQGFEEIVRYYVLVAHIFWGTWGVIQASVSAIDFDFLDWCRQRVEGFHIHSKLISH